MNLLSPGYWDDNKPAIDVTSMPARQVTNESFDMRHAIYMQLSCNILVKMKPAIFHLGCWPMTGWAYDRGHLLSTNTRFITTLALRPLLSGFCAFHFLENLVRRLRLSNAGMM